MWTSATVSIHSDVTEYDAKPTTRLAIFTMSALLVIQLANFYLVFVKDSVYCGPWQISHERECRARSASIERRRRETAGGERRAERVFRRRREVLRSNCGRALIQKSNAKPWQKANFYPHCYTPGMCKEHSSTSWLIINLPLSIC